MSKEPPDDFKSMRQWLSGLPSEKQQEFGQEFFGQLNAVDLMSIPIPSLLQPLYMEMLRERSEIWRQDAIRQMRSDQWDTARYQFYNHLRAVEKDPNAVILVVVGKSHPLVVVGKSHPLVLPCRVRLIDPQGEIRQMMECVFCVKEPVRVHPGDDFWIEQGIVCSLWWPWKNTWVDGTSDDLQLVGYTGRRDLFGSRYDVTWDLKTDQAIRLQSQVVHDARPMDMLADVWTIVERYVFAFGL